MSKLVTVPVLVAVQVEFEDESLTNEELIEKALQATQHVSVKVDNKDVVEDLGESVYVDEFFEVQSYEKICEGNFYYGHISEISIEEY